MKENNSLNFMLLHLFLMALSLNIPLIIIGAPGWVLTLVVIIVFASGLSGSVGFSYIYRTIHNILLRPGFYIWALIVAVAGEQDIISIAFYVILVCQLKSIICNLIGEIIILSSLFK